MKSLYFFSGFDKANGFPNEIAKSLLEHITSKNLLVFIASSPSGHEKTDLYKGVITGWFQNIGIEFESIDVLDDRKTAAECADLIKNASAVFLMGGTTFLQIEFLQKYNLIPSLKQFGGVVMGISAGAINMAVNSFYSADDHFGRTHIYKGVGLADISVEPHFSIDNTGLLENDILPFSYLINIHAICDDSAILICDGKSYYFGDIYLTSKGKIEKIH